MSRLLQAEKGQATAVKGGGFYLPTYLYYLIHVNNILITHSFSEPDSHLPKSSNTNDSNLEPTRLCLKLINSVESAKRDTTYNNRLYFVYI